MMVSPTHFLPRTGSRMVVNFFALPFRFEAKLEVTESKLWSRAGWSPNRPSQNEKPG